MKRLTLGYTIKNIFNNSNNSNYSDRIGTNIDNVIMLDDFFRFRSGRSSKYNSLSSKDMSELFDILINGIYRIADKKYAKNNADVIKTCYEIGCNILYDRKIIRDVIEKQKKYDVEYISDFFKYVLRIFLRRYEGNVVLTKNQCLDIKELCRTILLNSNCDYKYCDILKKVSSKEIIENIRKIDI